MPNWLETTLYVISALYTIGWMICAVKLIIDEDSGGVNPFSFWRKNTWLLWRVLWTYLQVQRVKWRAAQDKTRQELETALKDGRKELVAWAFKDPDSFLGDGKGVKRNTGPYTP